MEHNICNNASLSSRLSSRSSYRSIEFQGSLSVLRKARMGGCAPLDVVQLGNFESTLSSLIWGGDQGNWSLLPHPCMGCKGSSVRITPSRPKNSKKSSHLAVTGFFYGPLIFFVCLFTPLFTPPITSSLLTRRLRLERPDNVRSPTVRDLISLSPLRQRVNRCRGCAVGGRLNAGVVGGRTCIGGT